MLLLPTAPSLQPMAAGIEDEPPPQPRGPDAPPVINTWTPDVEKYRQTAWDEMPASIKARPDAAVQLDKFLHTMTYESAGGNRSALEPGSDGATGVMRIQNLPGRPSPQELLDPTTNIRTAWGLIEPNPDVWTAYGEGGATYNGQPFGALSQHPYGAGDPLVQHLSTGQTSFPAPTLPRQPIETYTPYQPQADAYPDVTTGMEQQMLPQQQEYAPGAGPSLTGLIGRPQGGFRATEMQPDPNADTSDPFALVGRAAGAVEQATRGPEIPYAQRVREAAQTGLETAAPYAKPILQGLATPFIGVPAAAATADVATKAAPQILPNLIPTNVRDALLTAVPVAGEASKLIDRALELASPETRFGVTQLASGTGGGGNRLAREMYETLRSQGVTDDEIRAAFGQSAVDAGQGVDVAGNFETQRQTEAALKAGYYRDTGHVTKRATALSDAMDAQAGETGTETVGGGKTVSASPEGTPATPTTTNAPTPVTTTTTEEDLFKQARDEAVARLAEQRGVAPEDLSFTDRAKAVAEVVQRMAKAKPGASVEDALGQARRSERVADAMKAAEAPLAQPSLEDALRMTQGQTFTPPADNPAAGQLGLAGQGGQMGVSEAGPRYTGLRPPEGATLNTQRLNRGLTEPTYQGEGASIPPPKRPAVNAQGEFGSDFTPGPAYKESAAHRAYREVLSLLNSPVRALTFGHEPIFRQGVGFALSHPGTAGEALKNLATVARNPEAATAINEALNAKPWVKAALDSGWLHEGARPPETFVNQLMNKIPGMQNSAESARIYLTTLRKMGYEQEAQRLWDMGVKDPDEYKSLWNTISDVTGHGLRDKSLTIGGMNPVFSPQAMAGRFRGLVDPFIEKGAFNPLAPGARSVAIRNLIAIGGMAASIDGIAKASGLDLKWDLLNTPLGKVSVGSSTLDPTAGYSSIFRMATRAYNATANGDLMALKRVPLDYLRGQLGPTVDTMVSTYTGQDWQGKDFNLMQEAGSGKLVKDLYEPIAARAIEDAVNTNGVKGGLFALPSLGAMSVETNLLQNARDKATTRLSGGKVTSYADAQSQPLLKQQVDKDAAVIEAKGSPSQYQQASDAAYAPIKAGVSAQEDLFTKGQNAQKLRDVYHDATEQNLAHAQDLSRQFADQFKSVPQSKQQSLLQDYYNIQPKVAEGEPGAGVDVDFDAQAAARKAFVATLPADQQDFISQSLQATENNKTPLRQEYDRYIDAKKGAGYFDIKADDPKASTKRAALDAAHPELDVAAWKFGSVAGKSGSSLNTAKAVDLALATPDAQNKEIKFAGLDRAINQTPETQQMWKYSAAPLTWYLNELPNGADATTEAKRLATATGDKEYTKPLQEMDQKHRATVTGNLHRAALAGNSELEAYLYAWGERTTLTTEAARIKAEQIIKQYHLDEAKAPKKKAA
jgi:hypothetical protein